MKIFIWKLVIIFSFHALCLDSKAQLLLPDELAALLLEPNANKITTSLLEKGYEYSRLPFVNTRKEAHESWYFNPLHSSGEKPNAIVTKITDSTLAVQIQYLLYNPYHYKQFIESLLKEKYRYEGISITGPFAYNIFRNDKTIFKISTSTNVDGNDTFEILLYQKPSMNNNNPQIIH